LNIGLYTALEEIMNDKIKINIEHLSFSYNDKYILQDINVRINENTINAIVGPSGIGKTTFLTIINRLWEINPGAKLRGKVEISFNGGLQDIHDPRNPVTSLRRSVGMVFQTPNPLPMSIFNNVSFPLKLSGSVSKREFPDRVEQALKRTFLWNEVKDRLQENALQLSGGQQQRLCIARALVLEPEVLLLDEPTSSLDVKAGTVIEELLMELKKGCTILIVSHYLDQVRRIADVVFELSGGKLIPFSNKE
jgi:phosphate transport system ATP-binding protein